MFPVCLIKRVEVAHSSEPAPVLCGVTTITCQGAVACISKQAAACQVLQTERFHSLQLISLLFQVV